MSIFEEVEENNKKPQAIIPKNIAFTKQAISEEVQRFVSSIEDEGDHNVLDVYTKCTALIEYFTNLKKGVQPLVEVEVAKYDKEGATSNGIKMNISNSASKYDYSHYDGWVNQKEIVDSESDELKRIENLMKKAEGTAGIVDEQTGEVIPPRVIKHHGSTVVRSTIPKS